MTSEPIGNASEKKASSKRNIKGYLVIFGIFIILPVVGLMVIWKDRCVDTVRYQVDSGGGFTARIIDVDCGTAMQPATDVRVGSSADQGTGESVLVLHGRQDIKMIWVEDKKLKITTSLDMDIVRSRHQAGEVAVVIERL